MQTKIKVIITTFALLFGSAVLAQGIEPSNRRWFSNYTYVKLNSKFYLDNYLVASFDPKKKEPLRFVQTDLGLNYILSKKIHLFTAYSNTQMKYFNSYKERYGKEPNAWDKFSVHRIGMGMQYRLKFMRL